MGKITIFYAIFIIGLIQNTLLPDFCNAAEKDFRLGAGFSIAIPQGALKNNLDTNSYGASVFTAYRNSKYPGMLGINFNFMNYGSSSRTEPFSPNIPDVLLKVTNNNELITGHLFARAGNFSNTYQPYAEALLGFNYFFTETSVSPNGDGESVIARTTNQDDFSASYGLGWGISGRIYQKPESETAKIQAPSSILLDLNMRYLFGTYAEYIKKGGITVTDGQVNIEKMKSRTDMVMILFSVIIKW